jgi:hypothetical protein
MTEAIRPGDVVFVRDARGERLRRRAMSGVVDGRDFPVVWVCLEEEWEAGRDRPDLSKGLPWPAEDVALDRAVASA